MRRYCAIAFVACFVFISGLMEASANSKQNVLVIHSYNLERIWTGALKKGIDQVFSDEPDVRLFHEYLDAKRYPDISNANRFWKYIEDKYGPSLPDVIMVSDDAAMQMLLKGRSAKFASVPIVFMGVNKVSQDLIDDPMITGVFENRNIVSTIFDIKALTDNDQLIIIGDKKSAGQANLSKADAAIGLEQSPEEIYFIQELTKADAKATLAQFSPDIPILVLGQIVDEEAGHALMDWREGPAHLASVVQNPIFTIGIVSVGNGAVGADNLDGELHGTQAAELAKKLVHGVPLERVPPIVKAESRWILDWQLLKHYGYSDQRLPAGAVLINQDESFYQKHKLMVWAVGLAFAVAILVIILLIEIIRRGNRTRDILIENEYRYKDLAQVGTIVFWETGSDHRLRYVSENSTNILNLMPEQILGKTFRQTIDLISHVDFPIDELEQFISEKRAVSNIVFRVRISEKDLQVFLLSGTPVVDKLGALIGYRGICKEVTQEHQLSQELAYLASYDSITGLINRAGFYKRLKGFTAVYGETSPNSYVCFLDLDRFKVVNDTAGHLVGDAMLGEVAKVISGSVGFQDYVGRLGGDEFGLLLTGYTPLEAKMICDEIIQKVSSYQFQWSDRYFNVGISIGMVHMAPGLSEIELLSKADLACYKAKEAGRGRVYTADADYKDLYNEELQMGYIANVSQSLEANQFFLMKQPIRSLAPSLQTYEHYEILIRYRDADGSMVSPALFIPAAEKHGVIGLIDRWVVETVFARYHEFFPQGNVMVSINLSGISLSSEEFIEGIRHLFRKYKIAPELICFEITETAVISQLSQALEFMRLMKSHGVHFALDDFGSGTSSFGYLKQLPVDYLKIDGSLIRNVVSEQTDQAIVSSINSIAHLMGMQTIAEFVEDDAIQDVLAEIGVDYVQGYGIGRPVNCEKE